MTKLTRNDCIEECCDIVALAYQSIGDYTQASDGFCLGCEERLGAGWDYQNDRLAIEFVRQAVVEKLQRDGYGISPKFPAPTYSSLPGR